MRFKVWTRQAFIFTPLTVGFSLSSLFSLSSVRGYFLTSTCLFYLLCLSPSVCPSVFPSLVCVGHFVLLHVSRPQRFEGFRNDKTMPPSLEPSCSGATEEGTVTANHLRLVSVNTQHHHSLLLFRYFCRAFFFFIYKPVCMFILSDDCCCDHKIVICNSGSLNDSFKYGRGWHTSICVAQK